MVPSAERSCQWIAGGLWLSFELSSVASSRAERLHFRLHFKSPGGRGISLKSCLGRSLPRLNYAAVRDDARAKAQPESGESSTDLQKENSFQHPAVALPLPLSPEVILSRRPAIPTEAITLSSLILNGLRMACRLHYTSTDEVARNGVLQRITSARGFL
jgi:hypothetical protein